jgi:predicted regulator of amino acid metabolism with ACT domain
MTIGPDGEELTDDTVETVDENGTEVQQNNWVEPENGTEVQQNNWVEPVELALISRHEDVQVRRIYYYSHQIILQVAALKDYYSNLTPNERKLKRADFMGFTVIPTIASTFIAGYWIIGMIKYNSPDWSVFPKRN